MDLRPEAFSDVPRKGLPLFGIFGRRQAAPGDSAFHLFDSLGSDGPLAWRGLATGSARGPDRRTPIDRTTPMTDAPMTDTPMTDAPPTCSHCGCRLKKWRVPEGSSWSEEFFFVCFNDDCSYYREGWNWMKEQYSQHASYRYMINPTNSASSSIPVWSDSATREMIEEDTEGGSR